MDNKENLALLHKIYNSKDFIHKGNDVLEILKDYLDENIKKPDRKTINYQQPESMLDYWTNYSHNDSATIYRDFLHRSIQIHNKKYLGHQVVPPAPDAVLATFIGGMLNNGGAVYEMGMASNSLEKVVIAKMLPYFGFDQGGDGIMTSGGTLANLTALLCARANKGDGVWTEGTKEKYAFMVSEEAHYCIDRAVRIMGWGEEGMLKIPVNEEFRMQTGLLEEIKIDAEKKGTKVLGIVGSAPTTSTGNYDDLKTIGDFASKHNIWFHIDAAHGGPAVFSPKYKHLMAGCEKADSITVDGHKMMMIPALTTKLLFKNAKSSYHTFQQEAEYLWGKEGDDWANAGKRTFECTKLIMSLRYFILIQLYGMKAFSSFVETCYDNGRVFAKLISDHPEFELAVSPDSNIVCFRPILADTLDKITNIRKAVLQEGEYYIVQTILKDKPYLRVSLMNPFTTVDELKGLLNSIAKKTR